MASKRVAVISAGDSNTGSAAALHLASKGYKLAILSTSGSGRDLAQALGGIGLTETRRSAASVERLVNLALDRWGRLDVLVNSAENERTGRMLDVGDDDLHVAMDAYLMNIVRPTRVVARFMATQGGGAIVNFSTFAALEPGPRFPTSSIFRAALANFSKLVYDRYAVDNVRMNNVFPSFANGLSETEDRGIGIPLWGRGEGGEMSSLLDYLVSDAAAHVSGQTLHFDAGPISQLMAVA